MLSEKALENFKKIWKEEYGEDIPNEKAVELSINLLTMFDSVYRPVKREWINEYPVKESLNQDKKSKEKT